MTFSSLDIYFLVELIVKSKYTVQENALALQKQSHDLHIFVFHFLWKINVEYYMNHKIMV